MITQTNSSDCGSRIAWKSSGTGEFIDEHITLQMSGIKKSINDTLFFLIEFPDLLPL
jgi:hypothetical protein